MTDWGYVWAGMIGDGCDDWGARRVMKQWQKKIPNSTPWPPLYQKRFCPCGGTTTVNDAKSQKNRTGQWFQCTCGRGFWMLKSTQVLLTILIVRIDHAVRLNPTMPMIVDAQTYKYARLLGWDSVGVELVCD